jgi:hypothetical protein
MSEVDIPVSDNFQPAPGVDYEETKVETPAESTEEAKAPETTEPVQAEPEKTETPAEPAEQSEPVRDDQGRFTKKAKPIADLLSKKHELETQLEAERQARAELEAKMQSLSQQSPSATVDDKIKALAEKHGLEVDIVADLISTAREGINPSLPKEVRELLQEREIQKATEAETQAFNKRVDSLANTLKDDQLKDPQVRQKLMQLAYSTETAPDGEPFHQKELAELYFGFIRPEIESGKVSAEPSRGGTQATTVLDFEEIARRDDPKEFEAMDDETFRKFNQWQAERNGKTPLRRL